jgi:hypothetical protein
MFLAFGFDSRKNAHYNMSAANQKNSLKMRGQGNEIIKKKQKGIKMNNITRYKYIFWIVLTVFLLSILTGS